MAEQSVDRISARAGLWGTPRGVLDRYVDLAKSGASVDDLIRYIEMHNLNLTREDAESTVTSVETEKKKDSRDALHVPPLVSPQDGGRSGKC